MGGAPLIGFPLPARSTCVLSVAMIVAQATAFITLMGWTLGIIEAIVLIVIVGISLDYSVHNHRLMCQFRQSIAMMLL